MDCPPGLSSSTTSQEASVWEACSWSTARAPLPTSPRPHPAPPSALPGRLSSWGHSSI